MTFYVWNRGRHGFSDPLVKVFKVTTTQSPERMLEMSVNHAYVLYDEFSILCCDNACVYDLVRVEARKLLGQGEENMFRAQTQQEISISYQKYHVFVVVRR